MLGFQDKHSLEIREFLAHRACMYWNRKLNLDPPYLIPWFFSVDVLAFFAWPPLEAQWRYFSYSAMLVAIVSQDSSVLVSVVCRTIILPCIAEWGITEMCLCETKYQKGISHHFGSLPNDNKISDNKNRKISKFYCHGIFPGKTAFWDNFRKFPPSPTPSKTQILLVLSFRRLWHFGGSLHPP